MSKFVCACGTVIDLVDAPAVEEHLLVPEINIEKAAQLTNPTEQEFYDVVDVGSRRVILCGNCGRLWLESKERTSQFLPYVIEGKEKEEKKEEKGSGFIIDNEA